MKVQVTKWKIFSWHDEETEWRKLEWLFLALDKLGIEMGEQVLLGSGLTKTWWYCGLSPAFSESLEKWLEMMAKREINVGVVGDCLGWSCSLYPGEQSNEKTLYRACAQAHENWVKAGRVINDVSLRDAVEKLVEGFKKGVK